MKRIFPRVKFADTNTIEQQVSHAITEMNEAVEHITIDFDLRGFYGVKNIKNKNRLDEELMDVLNIEDYLIRDKTASYLLEVRGESMIEAGICEGDMVIFERGTTPSIGILS